MPVALDDRITMQPNRVLRWNTHPPDEEGAADAITLFPDEPNEITIRVDEHGFLRLVAKTQLTAQSFAANAMRIVQARLGGAPLGATTFDTQ